MSRRRAIFLALLLFAVLFTITGALQYLFIRHQIRNAGTEQLAQRADILLEVAAPNHELNLAALRRTPPPASRFAILASDGSFIDIHGFVRGTITYAELPPGLDYERSVLSKSSLGEEWHLFARKVKGGSVIVGASSYNSPPDIDTVLMNAAKKFGDTIESAMLTVLGYEDANVDFAVLTDEGILMADNGGIPLKIKKPPLLLNANGPIIYVAGKPYFFQKLAILDRARHQKENIVMLTDFTREQELLHESLIFNVVVAATCLVLSGLLIAIDFYYLS